MTSVETQLLVLGSLMVVASGAAYRKTRSSWAVGVVVVAFTAVAYWLGLLV